MNRAGAALRYFAVLSLCFLVRLVPLHLPNIEPIMAVQMPTARRYGSLAGFCFGFLSIMAYDAITSGIGEWSWVTGLTYGLIGLAASRFFRGREVTRLTYAAFAFWSTIAYDALTGLTIGPLSWNQSLVGALVGQIPFTLYHLMGNVILAVVVSPAVYAWLGQENQEKVTLPYGVKAS